MRGYYERALTKLKADLEKTFPGKKLRAYVRDDERFGLFLGVHGKNVPLEVYYCIERALVDKRHPYVDLAWQSDSTDTHVLDRTGTGCVKRPEWYRTVDEQIEIEKCMDAAFCELQNARADLLARMTSIAPCRIQVEQEYYKRRVCVATILKSSCCEGLKKGLRNALIKKIHASIGEYFYGDGSNAFDLDTRDYIIVHDEVVYLTTIRLCGRGPFSNPLFAAIERERNAFRKIDKS